MILRNNWLDLLMLIGFLKILAGANTRIALRCLKFATSINNWLNLLATDSGGLIFTWLSSVTFSAVGILSRRPYKLGGGLRIAY